MSKEKAAHTPTPWRLHGGIRIASAEDSEFQRGDIAHTWNPENAKFIVRVVNAHDDLIAAIEGLLYEVGDSLTQDRQAYIDAHAALDKAKGKA